MKSTWVAAGLLLVTICQAAKDDPAVPTTTALPETDIQEINFVSLAQFTICYITALSTDNKYIVTVFKNGKEYDLPVILDTSMHTCLTAEDNIRDWSTKKIHLVIHGVTGPEEIKKFTSQADFTSFPEFPDLLKTSYGKDPLSTDEDDNKILRVEGNLNGMSLYKAPSVTDGENINYYVNVKTSTVVRPCFESQHQVKVCDAEVDKGKEVVYTGPTASIAILSYIDATNAQLKSDVTSSITTKAPIINPNPVSDQLEVIVTTESNGDLQLCVADASTPCNILWSGPGDNVANMRVIGVLKASESMQEITKHTIHDRQVQTTLLNGGILEGSWLLLSEQLTYTLILKDNSQLEISRVDVDCLKVTISHCFGYFLDVGPGTDYTITVKKKVNGDMKQVQSIPFSIKEPLTQKDLQIHVFPMEWHQNLMEVNTTICFSHETPNEEMIFSHYEMLLINTRGQWIKHKVMEEDDNDDILCFTPFTINTQEFDVTEGVKVVVSQRASDGFSVIASGGSPLF